MVYRCGVTLLTCTLRLLVCKDGLASLCKCGSWMSLGDRHYLGMDLFICPRMQVSRLIHCQSIVLITASYHSTLVLLLQTTPGYHSLEIRCWRPSGSVREELQSFFLGTSSCLLDEDTIFGKAWENRSQLVTVSSGIVKLNLTVLLRFFNEQNVG